MDESDLKWTNVKSNNQISNDSFRHVLIIEQ